MNTYEQVKAKADPWIKMYRKDLLVHDKNAIEGAPGMPFLHFTGETGTHIEFMPGPEDYPKKGERVKYLFGTADRQHILDQRVKCVKHMPKLTRQDVVLFYPGGNFNVRDISQEMANGIINDYRREIQLHWEKEVRK